MKRRGIAVGRVTGYVVVLGALGLSALSPCWGKAKARDVLLQDGFPPITDEDKSLTKVPYADGAPAAILLNAEQYEWFEAGDSWALRLHSMRRLKILTEAGAARFGDYKLTLIGDWRVKKVEARTVLPDGTIVDAEKSTFREKSDSGEQIIHVAFPRVQVGAILDLHTVEAADYAWFVEPWVLQETIPVLESRFTMFPPKGFHYRTASLKLPPEKTKPDTVRMGDRVGFTWSFENVEPLPDEPNLPALRDISQTLFVIPEDYRNEDVYVPLAKDWKSYGQARKEAWEEWSKRKSGQAAALAKQVTAGKTSALDKAESIRRALKERVRVDYLSQYSNRDSADDVLTAGAGSSGAVAGVAAAMLRSVGVEAHLAAIRRRSDGLVPMEFPVPALFNDLLVRIPSDKGPLYFSPVADLPVGLLPWDATDLTAFPYDGKTETPVKIPDFRGTDNKATRDSRVTLTPEGALSGESVETYQGISAERWRRSLRGEDAAARKTTIQTHLQRFLPGAALKSFEVVNLEDDSKDLIVKSVWETDGYASVAGKRLILNLNLFTRIRSDDWSAAQRKLDVDLGSNFETIETVTLTLPEAAGDATVPPPATMNAGPVGIYEASYEKGAGRVTTKRHMRLDMHRFPPQAFSGLKHWFSDIATADDRPVAIALK